MWYYAIMQQPLLQVTQIHMAEEKKDRNLDLFLAKLGLPPYTRKHTYKELCEKHNLSRHFIERKVSIYKLKYPNLWQKTK